jgi:5-methylcytosine-specific restriction protein A
MATYLLTWNPKMTDWYDFMTYYEDVSAGYQVQCDWSCGNTKKIRKHDRVFMMRLGEPPKGIFASGTVTSEQPEKDSHWREPDRFALYIDFVIDAMLSPDLDPLLDPITVSTDVRWTPQSSGTSIPDEIAEQLEYAWLRHLEAIGASSSPMELTSGQLIEPERTYQEGNRSKVTVNRYERNTQARRDCIEEHGISCKVCGFDFEETYGEIGADFIHVHHLKPLSECGEEYEVDPIKDLLPVCPNCHSMLHRKTPPFSIDELKRIMHS